MTEKGVIEKEWNRLDGTWSCVIMAAAFCCMAMTYGICMTVGIYHTIFLEAFHGGSGITAIISALPYAMMCFVGPLCTIVVNRWSIRISVILGGTLTSLGLVLSSFANGVYFLIISFGVVTGAGLGFAYAASFMVIASRFEHYRGLAMGVMSAGSGVGITAFPFFIEKAVCMYGWRGSLLLLGGITLNMCVCGALMFPAYTPRLGSSPQSSTLLRKQTETAMCRNVMTNPLFIILCCNCVFLNYGISVFNTHMPAFAIQNIGLSDYATASLVSISGVMHGLGKVLLGVLLNFHMVRNDLLLMSCYGLMAVGVACIPFASSYIEIASLSALCGTTVAAYGPVLSELMIAYVGLDLYNTAFGFMCLFSGVGGVIGAPSAGWLYDALEVYPPLFYLGGGCILLSASILVLPLCLERCGFRTEQKSTYRMNDPDAGDKFLGADCETSI